MEEAEGKKLSTGRVQASLLASPEKKVLVWMAQRLPVRVSPDALTFLGFLAMAGVGVAYFFALRHWLFLLLAGVCLVLNWFGDSLDGTVARVRNKQRPKYGYYLDHLVDSFGVSFMLFGLAYSGLVTPALCFAVLALYLIMSINVYLATQTVGVFQISFARISPTEGRIILIGMNILLIFHKSFTIFGRTFLILDLIGASSAILLLVLIVSYAAKNLLFLNATERELWH